jgi:protein phosphatase
MSSGKERKLFQFGNHTDIGKVRSENEDYLGYFETLNGHLFVVCDGMGGHVGGAKASQLAVESIRTFFEHGTYEHPQEALRQSVLYANQEILTFATQNPDLRGMGTTCVVVLVRENELNYAHVGDSRLYLLSNNRLIRLTKDHSVVQEMVSQGMIKEEEAENHPRKNELTRALGTQYNVQVEVCERPLYPSNNDIFLLCTDGLNGMINDAVIKQVLTENVTLQHKAIKLVQLANDAGGFDNITVQLIQFNTNSSNVIAEDMAATKANAKTKTKKKVTTTQVINQRVDPALIVLCILVGVVIILFFVGYDQLSDGTISTSELTQEQLMHHKQMKIFRNRALLNLQQQANLQKRARKKRKVHLTLYSLLQRK